MAKMAKSLRKNGYNVHNIRYPSTKHSIEELATSVIKRALMQCEKGTLIHFVTHSLGGILVRQYLSEHTIRNLGNVVMLGPPNQGSEIVDVFQTSAIYRIITGPAGMQLGTKENSILSRLGPADFVLGVIAGSRSINLILSTFLSKENDGKVSVEKTKLEGMADHITLPIAHPFLMTHSSAIKQTLYFLRHGYFKKHTR